MMRRYDRHAAQRIADFIVEDILETSDKEILAEAIEDGIDPEELAATIRELVMEVLREGKTNKE